MGLQQPPQTGSEAVLSTGNQEVKPGPPPEQMRGNVVGHRERKTKQNQAVTSSTGKK